MCMKIATMKPAFSSMKSDDQRPAQYAVQVEVIDQVRERAEDEQQHQIQK